MGYDLLSGIQLWVWRQTMSRTVIGFGISPSLWNRSATACCVVTISSVTGTDQE